MSKGYSGLSDRGGSSGAGGSGLLKKLSEGEKPFVEIGKRDKRAIVVENEKGEYIYKGFFSKETPNVMVLKNSEDYKTALRSCNIKASVLSDGSVVVKPGGLYSRKKTFKTKETFLADANKRLGDVKSYYQRDHEATKKGFISQLQAENFKSIAKKHASSDALKEMRKSMESDLRESATRVLAADDMKDRLKRAFKR